MKIPKRLFFAVFCMLVSALVFLPTPVKAVSTDSDVTFYVDSDYDAMSRQKVEATLVQTSSSLYFYVEKQWWNVQSQQEKNTVLIALESLSYEFNNNIYPKITSAFGSEWKPGIDNDARITVLFHDIKDFARGYFRTTDEYSKLQDPTSNQREMIYLSVEYIKDPKLKEFFAHEFTHLIEFNQKERLQGVQEETWLNEARAEYALTLLGYNTIYQGSNLQRRVGDFLQAPDDSLTEWKDSKYDYAVLNMFTQYLVDHYGVAVLSNSLKSNAIGIASLDKALAQLGAKEKFADIFTNWTIATVINDCAAGLRYCYLHPHLVNLRVNPSLVFLPLGGNSSLQSSNFTKNWAGNWHKIVGGNGDVKFAFSVRAGLDFRVPYILIDKAGSSSVRFLALDEKGTGEITINDFSGKYSSLIIIPTLQDKTSGFNGFELSHTYEFFISNQQSQQEDSELIQSLLAQIEYLKAQIAKILVSQQEGLVCKQIYSNLYLNMPNNSEVSCLQKVLASQGKEIYPEGLVTGYFGNLTRAAVVRFQEKYRTEILVPLGLTKGTGYVGASTRQKINKLLVL